MSDTTLYIDTSSSTCGACGKTCLPLEPAHTSPCGYDWHEGCGAVYTHVSSHYLGMQKCVTAMRPDLIWVSNQWEPAPLSGYTQTAREAQ